MKRTVNFTKEELEKKKERMSKIVKDKWDNDPEFKKKIIKHVKKDLVKPVYCVTDGYAFYSNKDAGLYYGYDHCNMARHINGSSLYKTIMGGRKFEYISKEEVEDKLPKDFEIKTGINIEIYK